MSLNYYSTISSLPSPAKVEGFNFKICAITVLWQTFTTKSPYGSFATTTGVAITVIAMVGITRGGVIGATGVPFLPFVMFILVALEFGSALSSSPYFVASSTSAAVN